jgi:hypothetical protein
MLQPVARAVVGKRERETDMICVKVRYRQAEDHWNQAK